MNIRSLIPIVLGQALIALPSYGYSAMQPYGVPLTAVNFDSLLKNELSQHFHGATVEFKEAINWTQGSLPRQVKAVSILGEDGKGSIHFKTVNDQSSESAEGWVKISAMVVARAAARRIYPGEPLNSKMFFKREVDIAGGEGYDYRGILFTESTDSSSLEATHTILEGQLLVGTSVRKIPDIRRGDFVRIHLVSGGILLSTSGVAEEPGYLQGQVRVLTTRGKRELVGKLQSGGTIEVHL